MDHGHDVEHSIFYEKYWELQDKNFLQGVIYVRESKVLAEYYAELSNISYNKSVSYIDTESWQNLQQFSNQIELFE